MADTRSCEHLDRLVEVIAKELWQTKEAASCLDCGCTGANLWVCLQGDCLHVGCSENHNDHSTFHFKDKPQHCVHMNMTTKRVWCYRCNMEVFPRAALANAALNQEIYQLGGLKGAGERLRTLSSLGLERGPGLNVSSAGDSQDSSDGEEEDCNVDGKPRGLVGLQNIGNTCYMNSAIQALSNTPPLTQYFLDCAAAVDFLTDSKKPGLSRSFHKLVKEIWNKKTRGYVVPNGILYGIRNVHPMFRGYHQHDTQEFLRCFMDQLHEELKEPVRESQQQAYINRQPKQGTGSRTGDEPGRRLYRGPQSPARSHENISSAKGYFRVHSQSECSGGVSGFLPGHRRSASYCPLPQDSTKDESKPPPQARQPSVEGETEAEDEEESYETCDSGVSDSAELSGDEGYQRKTAADIADRLSSGSSTIEAGNGGGDEGDRLPSQRYRSVISDVFDGRLLSSVQCLTCNRISTRVETFQDLSLPIPSRDHMAVLHGGTGGPSAGSSGGRGAACSDAVYSASASQEGWMWWLLSWFRSWLYGPAVTLYDCLAAFFSADELKGDNMYSCEKCNKLRNGVKFSRVLGLPEVLCVHLKRFRHELMSSTKIGAKVSFPLSGLDMRPYLHKECTSGVYTYDLVAVICHAGTAGGGHYTCVARNRPSERWFEFDDQYVTGCSPQQVAACEAYVLFYKKSNPRMAALRQQMVELLETTVDLNDIKFYISKQWLNRFNTYAEPGPVDNGDFLCEHGCVAPERLPVVERLTMEISQPLWEFFYQNFGGGPACNQLHACAVCRAADEKLKRRQKNELQRFHSNTYSEQKAIYAISMNWFRSWQAFAHNKTQQPPPAIDNSSIVVKTPVQENASGRSLSPNRAVLKPGSDYSQIGEDCWKFFHGIYGGGPEVKLKSAPNYSNTVSYNNSQGYNSGSESYNSYNTKLQKSRNSMNYEQFSNKQTDSEDNSSVEHTTVKSLSNADLFFISNFYTDAEKNVKGTQSLQDVSLQQYGNGIASDDRQNSHRMSIESDSQMNVEAFNKIPAKQATVTNGKSAAPEKQKKNKTATPRQNGKQKGGKANRKRSNRTSDTLKSNSSCEEIPPIGDSIQTDAVKGMDVDISCTYNNKDNRVNNNHIEDENLDYMSYEDSAETLLDQNNKCTPKVGKKSRNLSTDMHSVCSSMQAVSVEMPSAEGVVLKSNSEPATGVRNSFTKRSSRE